MDGRLEIYMAAPRGFCAGVKRAITLVEQTLADFGAPVYVRHEIVHNKHVVEELRQRGAIFIEEFSEMTDAGRPVIISAHGAPRAIKEEAARRGLTLIDATCPLVAKVHRQIRRLEAEGREIIVIGKREHPEIVGTIGQVNCTPRIHIINSLNDAHKLELPPESKVGVVTQTTLSVDDTAAVIAVLKMKFPELATLHSSDICYATTHRQKAVRAIAAKAEGIIVIGSENSSNSRHLRDTALQNGARKAWLIDDAGELPLAELKGITRLGISAGASAPDYLADEVVAKLREHYENLNIHHVTVAEETTVFKS